MIPIDWRELYASNRAVIEGAAAPGDHLAVTRRRGPSQPDRAIAVHVPPGLDPGAAVPLVVMLHGCTQDAEAISTGSRMNEIADRSGFVVAYPEQTRRANPQGCWNWFLSRHQARDGGEPGSIAAATRKVLAGTPSYTIDPRRVYVAGMSAGGAMAGVMAATHPDLFAAVAVHSGLPVGAASGATEALRVMSRGSADPAGLGEIAARAMGAHARALPTIVLHGTADRVVAPINGEQLLRQWMDANRMAAPGDYEPSFDHPSSVSSERTADGLAFNRSRWRDRHGRLMQEHLSVEQLGHAWSGGAPGGSFTDPRGPSASEQIWRFFEESSADR